MKGQFDLLESTGPDINEKDAFEIISPSLYNVLDLYHVDHRHLMASSKRGYTSILFQSSLIARLCFRGTHSYFSVSSSYWKLLKSQNDAPTQGFIQIFVDSPSINLVDYQYVFTGILTTILDRMPKDYDCCSRYLACSDAKKCIHPDMDFAMGCGYKKIMIHGKIFYGKNRNID